MVLLAALILTIVGGASALAAVIWAVIATSCQIADYEQDRRIALTGDRALMKANQVEGTTWNDLQTARQDAELVVLRHTLASLKGPAVVSVVGTVAGTVGGALGLLV